MSTALITVDVQNDFLPNGALAVPDGHKATVLLERLMREVDVIVFTRDWHPDNHISFVEPGLNPTYTDMDWPKHCVQGTHGAELDSWLWEQARNTDKIVLLVAKGAEQDKEAYSGFAGKVTAVIAPSDDDRNYRDFIGLPLANALYDLSVHHIKIGGLALDYCVKATAIDARDNWGDVTVYLNATRPVAYLTGAQAVADLIAAGVRLDSREF